MSPERVKLLLLYVDELDTYGESRTPLYEAIVHRLMQLGVAGATVHTGIMGYGSHHRLHRKGLFGISDDRPVTISVLDEEARLRAALPEITAMLRKGMAVLVDAEVVYHG